MKPYCRPIRTWSVSQRADPAITARTARSARNTPSLFITARSRDSALRAEPVHHDAIEDRRLLDIRQMTGGGDLLVARAGDERGDPFVRGGRCAQIVGTADDQRRDLEGRQ